MYNAHTSLERGDLAVDWMALVCGLLLLPIGLYVALYPQRVRKSLRRRA